MLTSVCSVFLGVAETFHPFSYHKSLRSSLQWFLLIGSQTECGYEAESKEPRRTPTFLTLETQWTVTPAPKDNQARGKGLDERLAMKGEMSLPILPSVCNINLDHAEYNPPDILKKLSINSRK